MHLAASQRITLTGPTIPYLISIFFGECDCAQFEVLLHEVLVRKEVQCFHLVMFDGFLWQHNLLRAQRNKTANKLLDI